MSTYTEIYVKAVLKGNVDDNVINILNYMLGMDDVELEDLALPSHNLFETERWHYMLRSGSHHHIPYNVKLFEYNEISNNYYLVVRSDFITKSISRLISHIPLHNTILVHLHTRNTR